MLLNEAVIDVEKRLDYELTKGTLHHTPTGQLLNA